MVWLRSISLDSPTDSFKYYEEICGNIDIPKCTPILIDFERLRMRLGRFRERVVHSLRDSLSGRREASGRLKLQEGNARMRTKVHRARSVLCCKTSQNESSVRKCSVPN